MDFKWPWLIVGLGALVVVLLVVWSLPPRRRLQGLLVAHTARLRSLPRYRRTARQQLLISLLRTAGVLLIATGAILLSARPVRVELTAPDRTPRDIQLCLDVSGSMDRWNRQVVDGFRKLIADLAGERMGLTIFSGAAVTAFPLTDDYEFILDRLDEAERGFRTGSFAYVVGAETPDRRASLIGDGLVSCVQRFDRLGDGRGRAIVLASDNKPVGKQIFTLPEAAEVALRREVVVYGIGVPALARSAERTAAFEEAAESTGGTLSFLDEDADVDELVSGIQRLERARLEQPPRPTELDDPARPFWLACSGMGVLMLGSLIRRRS